MDLSYKQNVQTRETNKDNYKRMILIMLVTLAVIQQMPIIKDLLYNQIRIVLYLGFGIFSIISILHINAFLKSALVRSFMLTIIYSLALYFVVRMFVDGSSEIFELLIPFGILISSLNTNFNKRQLNRLLICYILLSIILGLSSILYYGEGLAIAQRYFLAGKNQIGPLLGISAIISGIWILNKNQLELKYSNFIIRLIPFALLATSILVIRNRSGFLGVSVVTLICFLKGHKLRKNLKSIIYIQIALILFVILFLLGAFDGVFDFVYKAIFLNYDISDMNSVSAGRTDVYKSALEFVLKYPILGEIGGSRFTSGTPHNYILNKWVKYGIIGSLPIVLFYLNLWIFVFKEIKFKRKNTNVTLPLWVLLFSLVVSMLEYTYPYGPGVSQLMVWFLLGQYFKLKSELNAGEL